MASDEEDEPLFWMGLSLRAFAPSLENKAAYITSSHEKGDVVPCMAYLAGIPGGQLCS